MIEKKNYYWVPPLIGGILSLIALATPATYTNQMGLDFYVWMWGLASISLYHYYYGTFTDTTFTDNMSLLIPSIICTLLVFISAVALIVFANMNRRGTAVQEVKNKWYFSSILLIITTAGWMIVYEVVAQVETSFSWWENMDPGFGVIGIFIGAVISLIGTAVSSYMVRQGQRVITPYKQLPTEQGLPIQKGPQPMPTTAPKFCPMCGNKIENETFKFCSNCGFKLID